MTTETIIENNKLIAEFMGLEKYGDYFQIEDENLMEITGCENGEITSLGYLFTPEQLKFHTSWDWLMPVIRKIGELPFAEIKGLEEYLKRWDIYNIYTSINFMFEAVVEFINWYNQQQKDI